MTGKTNVAEQIRRNRTARGLTQEDLGALSGVSCALISRYERGRVTPSLATLVKLARALHMELSALV